MNLHLPSAQSFRKTEVHTPREGVRTAVWRSGQWEVRVTSDPIRSDYAVSLSRYNHRDIRIDLAACGVDKRSDPIQHVLDWYKEVKGKVGNFIPDTSGQPTREPR